ncbi:sensor histidine kinase [Anaerosporobacter faecicola]|uniref:sensor histidine kinase n=1 Tax=Anaerosporobacter faecicola TaxID=2718714 RepID=UPI0014389388|nr:sensor histidine kinase [Anaerosporobacter faecicola]
MNYNNQDHNALSNSPLIEIADFLLMEARMEKKKNIDEINEIQSNIDILQKDIAAIEKNECEKTKDIFTVNNHVNSNEENKMRNELLIWQQREEQLQVAYDKISDKEKKMSVIAKYVQRKEEEQEATNQTKCSGDVDGLKLLETQEIERKRIARELHDTTVQNLTNLVHKTELCTKLVDLDPIRAKLELQTMIQTIKSTINDMRNIIYDLRPMSLEDLGLVITVKRYIKQFIDSNRIKVELNVENERSIQSDIIDLTLFRIIQEACNNALKHAKATIIQINLIYNENTIDLVIEDNGCGFSQNNSVGEQYRINQSMCGFGLSMMKERVGLLSGKLDITSEVGTGTKISVCVPIK